MSARVGLVTAKEYPLTDDDRLTIEPMRRLGMEPEALQWDDTAVDFPAFDALVVRSVWDYFVRPSEFASWLDDRERDGSNLWNPSAVLKWNFHKRYLRELDAAGIRTVDTEWLERGSQRPLDDVLRERGWNDAVAKPAVSGGAWQTFRIARGATGPADGLTEEHDVMVQPFLPQILDEGEWSFIFFGGAFCGAILKKPNSGDYRVQERHGGSTITISDPPAAMIDQASRVLGHAPGDLLYARVDGVRDGSDFVLIELEVLEPSLFFANLPAGAERFAEALAGRLA